MKISIILFACIAFIACNQKGKDEQNQAKTNTIVWAETAESNLPIARDTMWSKDEWDKAYKMDKGAIFNSVKKAVLAGKLKAYSFLRDEPLTIAEFNSLIVRWDSTHTMEDANHPGTIVSAPIKYEVTPDDVAELRFDEKIEYDTVSNSVSKKVSAIHFVGFKINEMGEILGKKPLFDVKFPDGDYKEAKK